MVAKRRKSGRQTLKTKYLIEKKVRAHKKKVKRLKKKQPELFRKKKDPGVPKSLPFYKEVIEEAQQEKELSKERALEAVKVRQELLEKKLQQERLEEMVASAERRAEEFKKKRLQEDTRGGKFTDQSAKKYYRELKKVVEASDVLLEVLDARDPMGCRVPQIEQMVRNKGKKLVLVLNKVDLVPRPNVEGWLKYLRQEFPTIPFKATTQKQGKQLGQNNVNSAPKILNASYDELTSSKAIGTEILMQLLKNYCRNKDIKMAITVGVVGIPNVGKSSLINSMKRNKTCGVGGTPGVTRSMQDVRLDSKINILDCPGIVLPGEQNSDLMSVLKNAVKIEQLDDPIEAVRAIYMHGNKEQLRKLYWTGKTKSLEEFLSKLAKRLGRLTKGGIGDQEMAARKILQDWSAGVIKYYTEPPEVEDTKKGKASLKKKLSKEFDISTVCEDEGVYIRSITQNIRYDRLNIVSSDPVQSIRGMEVEEGDMEDEEIEEEEIGEEGEEESEESADEMEVEEEAEEDNILPKKLHIDVQEKEEEAPATLEKRPRWETPVQPFDPDTMSLKKYSKKMMKKLRKEGHRNERRAEDLTNLMQSFSGITSSGGDKEDAYDFGEFF